jgi:CheY-like chemotaxis protein
MDIMMPVMNGWESAKRITQELPTYQQPIIVGLTADVMEETRLKSLESGIELVNEIVLEITSTL